VLGGGRLGFILKRLVLEISPFTISQVHVSKPMLVLYQEYWVLLAPANCQVSEHNVHAAHVISTAVDGLSVHEATVVSFCLVLMVFTLNLLLGMLQHLHGSLSS
jgi:hypothetical protein